MAAVNAFYNTRSRVEAWTGRPLEELRAEGAFSALASTRWPARRWRSSAISRARGTSHELRTEHPERNPLEGDLPDFAAEYVLPEQDHYIFITGTALTNKTMPRLLELCAQATVALVGSTGAPLVPWWFDLGVDILAGAVVTDKAAVWRRTQEGGHRGIFERGAWTVQVRKATCARTPSGSPRGPGQARATDPLAPGGDGRPAHRGVPAFADLGALSRVALRDRDPVRGQAGSQQHRPRREHKHCDPQRAPAPASSRPCSSEPAWPCRAQPIRACSATHWCPPTSWAQRPSAGAGFGAALGIMLSKSVLVTQFLALGFDRCGADHLHARRQAAPR